MRTKIRSEGEKKVSQKISLDSKSGDTETLYRTLKDLVFGIKRKKLKYPSRSLYRAPERLARLIRLVNLIPPDRDLPDGEVFFPEISTSAQMDTTYYKKGIYALEKSLADLPQIFWLYIMDDNLDRILFRNPAFDESDFNSAAETWDFANVTKEISAFYEKKGLDIITAGRINRYEQFRFARALLYEVAMVASLPEKNRLAYQSITTLFLNSIRDTNTIHDKFPDDDHKLIQAMIARKRHSGVTNYEIDKNGIFRVSLSPSYFFEALEGINVTRLRICEICDRLFWAERNNKKTCRPQCAVTLRKRRSRENQKISGQLYAKAKKKKLTTNRKEKA